MDLQQQLQSVAPAHSSESLEQVGPPGDALLDLRCVGPESKLAVEGDAEEDWVRRRAYGLTVNVKVWVELAPILRRVRGNQHRLGLLHAHYHTPLVAPPNQSIQGLLHLRGQVAAGRASETQRQIVGEHEL